MTKIRREEHYHLLHMRLWFTRLGSAGGEATERMRRAVRDLWTEIGGLFSLGDAESRLLEFGIIPFGVRRAQEALGGSGAPRLRGGEASLAGFSGGARYGRAKGGAYPRFGTVAGFDDGGVPVGSGRQVVSGAGGSREEVIRMSDNRSALWQALQEVKDPEIPTISLVDLGMIHRLLVEGDRVTVEILPTFVGCPALDIIRRDVRKRLLQVEGVADVEVKFVYDPPWTSDRITEEGRKRLASFGIAPPRPAGGKSHGYRSSLPLLRRRRRRNPQPLRADGVPFDFLLQALPPAL